jgi:hypothetical protein
MSGDGKTHALIAALEPRRNPFKSRLSKKLSKEQKDECLVIFWSSSIGFFARVTYLYNLCPSNGFSFRFRNGHYLQGESE